MAVYIARANVETRLRVAKLSHCGINVARVLDVELVADAAQTSVPVWCEAAGTGVLFASIDGGSTWLPLGTTRATAAELGPVIVGRNARKLKFHAPAGTSWRRRLTGLRVGQGY